MSDDQNTDTPVADQATAPPAETPIEPTPDATTTPEPQPFVADNDIDLASRYGDELPDVVQSLLPSGNEAGEEPIAQPQTPGGAVPPTDGSQPAVPQAQPGTQPVTQQPQPQPGVTPDPIAQVQQQIAGLTQVLSSQQAQTQAPQGEPAADPLETVPEYNFDIPDQLVNMMASEDPAERKQAMASLVRGVSQTIHQQLTETIKGVRDSVPQSIGQAIQMQELSRTVNTDFYGKYPTLNTDQMRPIVKSTAEALMKQDIAMGIQPQWTPQFMERVGVAVNQLLGPQAAPAAVAPNNGVPAAPAAPAATEPPAAFGAGGANHAGKMGKTRTTQQDIMDQT